MSSEIVRLRWHPPALRLFRGSRRPTTGFLPQCDVGVGSVSVLDEMERATRLENAGNLSER